MKPVLILSIFPWPFQTDSHDKVVSSHPPSHDPVPKRRDSRSGGSSEVANEDIYGISRGKCNECDQCEVYMTAASGKNSVMMGVWISNKQLPC